MAFVAGAITVDGFTDTTADLTSADATGGTTPYTYQWYRSTVSGFTPGGGNILSGETDLVLADDGLTEATQYYYKVIATDAATTPLHATSAQASVLTADFAAGALSAANIGSRSVALTSAAATAGNTPVTYQWYRSQTSDFTPGGGNILTGKTALTFTDDTIVPATQYYYKVIATDGSTTPVHATSSQLSVLAAEAIPVQNQFEQSPTVGQLDLPYNYNSIAVQIDTGETGTLKPGQAVKFTADAGGVPKVEACDANTDQVAGFLNYNIKNRSFLAGDYAEMSQRGNVMYLIANEDIDRGERVMIAPLTPGGVAVATTGKPVCGFALDTVVVGDFVRIELMTPAYELAP